MEKPNRLQKHDCDNNVHLLVKIGGTVGLEHNHKPQDAWIKEIHFTYEFQDKAIPRCY
jgi:hypothetical protein